MLDISPSLILTTLVVFLFMIWVLNVVLYQPLLQFMDKRDSLLKDKQKKIVRFKLEIDEFEIQAKEIVNKTKIESTKIKDEMLINAKEVKVSKIRVKDEELNIKYQSFLKQLSESRDEVKNSLLSKLPLFKSALKNRFNQV